MKRSTISAIAVGAMLTCAGLPASVSAGASVEDYGYIPKGSNCIQGTHPTPGNYAAVRFLMMAGPTAQTDVQHFVIHARLIPHGSTTGQNWWRSFPGNVSPLLGPGRSSLLMKTWAKVPDVGKDWDLQVKLQWKRDLNTDWNRTVVIKFNEAACPGYAEESGGVVAPAVQQPMVNAG